MGEGISQNLAWQLYVWDFHAANVLSTVSDQGEGWGEGVAGASKIISSHAINAFVAVASKLARADARYV